MQINPISPHPGSSRPFIWSLTNLFLVFYWFLLHCNPAQGQQPQDYRLTPLNPFDAVPLPSPAKLFTAFPNFQGNDPRLNGSLSGTNQQINGISPNLTSDLSYGNAQRIQQQTDLERETWQNEFTKTALEKEALFAPYRNAFDHLSHMDADHFSLTEATYEVENAYLSNRLRKEDFVRGLQLHARHVRQILRRQGLSAKNNLALNYGIQQLFEHPNGYFDSSSQSTHIVPPFKYDFNDYMGEKDYTKMFTSKLLATGSGQCHSLPLVYLMIAEQLGAKAWLSLAPEHSFVQFMDSHGRLLDYETTNGNIVSACWLAGSGYINAKALRNKTYLDTLSRRKLYARCLADLLLGYLQKFDFDGFAKSITDAILQADPSNITALIVDANVKRQAAWQAIVAAGRPKPADLPKYPAAYRALQEMKIAAGRLEDLGYQDMPPEAYQAWLKSIDIEKNRIETQKLQQRIKLEAKMKTSTLQNIKN